MPDQLWENEDPADSSETSTRTIREARQKGDLGSKMKEVLWFRANLLVNVSYRPKLVDHLMKRSRLMSVFPVG